MRKVLIVAALTVAALTIVVSLTMMLGAASNSDGFPCDGQRVREGDALATAINRAPAGTTFCVEAGTYPISETVNVQDGDVIRGEPGTITRRGPAVDPDPVVHIRNAKDLARMFHVTARTGRMEWLDIQGSPNGGRYTGDPRETCEHWGEASDRCPQVGTGVAVGAGQSGAEFVFEHLQVHDNPAQCISGLKGKLLRSELHHCSRNADFWGYSAAALKTINEQESAHNFVHDNEAVGLWCDQGCRDNPATPEGWHQHDNLVLNNGRSGIRYEFSPMLGNGARSRQPSALIENNLLAGNAWGGVSVHDAQNATVRGNTFGSRRIAGTQYRLSNSEPKAMQFSESATSQNRTDLWNVEAYGNRLFGEAMIDCEKYTDPDKLYCHDNSS